MTHADLFPAGSSHGAPDRARWADHHADFTPRPVVRQLMEWLTPRILPPGTCWDPFAGAGVFASEMHRAWPDAEVHATELRDEETENLEHNADVFSIGHYRDSLVGATTYWDLIATNPAFKATVDAIPYLVLKLSKTGTLALLMLSDFGQRSKVARELFAGEFRPHRQLRIPFAIQFRVGLNAKTGKPYTSDMRSYSWWVWQRNIGRAPGETIVEDLPALPLEDRRWVVRPGTEWRVQE